MQMPTIHMNGTSPESLIEGYCDAINALRDAIEAVKACAPNGRDYYGVRGDMTATAHEHVSRVDRLETVRRELNTLAEHAAGL